MRLFTSGVIQTLPQGRFAGQLLNAKGLAEDPIAFIQIHVIKVHAAITKYPRYRQQTIPVADPIDAAWLKVLWQMFTGKLLETVSHK